MQNLDSLTIRSSLQLLQGVGVSQYLDSLTIRSSLQQAEFKMKLSAAK